MITYKEMFNTMNNEFRRRYNKIHLQQPKRNTFTCPELHSTTRKTLTTQEPLCSDKKIRR